MAEKKKFIEVELPLISSESRVLGSVDELKGKTIKLDLSRKLRGKGLVVKFRIFENEGSLIGVASKMELLGSYIRRMMRKRVDYVEDSFKANCLDLKATVKPFLITRKRVSRAVRRNLRNTAREFLMEYLKEREYNVVCEEILNGVIQKAMLPKLKKVYPLSMCEIRVFETKEMDKIDIKKVVEQGKGKEEPELEEKEESLEVEEEEEEESPEVEEEEEEESQDD